MTATTLTASNPQATPTVDQRNTVPSIAILGVPFANLTKADAVSEIVRMIGSGKPHYLATANVDFLVKATHDVELRRILNDADMVVCDGTPLLWVSRLLGNPLPERIAGADLVPTLIQVAEQKGYRVFFLGGSPEVSAKATANLKVQFPRLEIAGSYSPPSSPLLEMQHGEMIARIRAAKPDILFVSFGCPKQEKWISMNYRKMGVPVSVGVGATIDFLAGKFSRAPIWMQRCGLEWIYRLVQEPRRLFYRYTTDLIQFSAGIVSQWCRLPGNDKRQSALGKARSVRILSNAEILKAPSRLDAAFVSQRSRSWESAQMCLGVKHLICDLSSVEFIDSTGVSELIRFNKAAKKTTHSFILLAPSKTVRAALNLMKLTDFFHISSSVGAAIDLARATNDKDTPHIEFGQDGKSIRMKYQREITVENCDRLWRKSVKFLPCGDSRGARVLVDLSSVKYIDTAGIKWLLSMKKRVEETGAEFKLSHVREPIFNVIKQTKTMDTLLGNS